MPKVLKKINILISRNFTIEPILDEIEEKLSHIMKSLDELSDIVAKHETTISLSASRIEKLMSTLAEKELESGGAAYFQDDKPPHY